MITTVSDPNFQEGLITPGCESTAPRTVGDFVDAFSRSSHNKDVQDSLDEGVKGERSQELTPDLDRKVHRTALQSPFRQFGILFSRSVRLIVAQPVTFVVTVLANVVFGLILGSIFFNVDETEAGAFSRVRFFAAFDLALRLHMCLWDFVPLCFSIPSRWLPLFWSLWRRVSERQLAYSTPSPPHSWMFFAVVVCTCATRLPVVVHRVVCCSWACFFLPSAKVCYVFSLRREWTRNGRSFLGFYGRGGKILPTGSLCFLSGLRVAGQHRSPRKVWFLVTLAALWSSSCVFSPTVGSLPSKFGERTVFAKQSSGAGFYSVLPFVLSASLVDAVTILVKSTCYACAIYWLAGLNPGVFGERFAFYILVIFSLSLFVSTYARALSTLSNKDLANALAGVGLIVMVMFSGFLGTLGFWVQPLFSSVLGTEAARGRRRSCWLAMFWSGFCSAGQRHSPCSA